MKKVLCLILLVTLMLGSVAFAEIEEEIKFRGVDWGLAAPDVLQTLSSGDIKWKSGSVTTGRKIESQASGEWSNYYGHDCLYYVEMSSSSSLSVAGYDVSSATLYFACTEKDGKITHDAADTTFYMAKYRFKPKDLQAVYDDFVVKLSSIYGEPDQKYTDNGIITYQYTYWYGKNNTAVILTSDDNWDNVDINYVWYEGEEVMKKADELQRQAELDEESSHFGTDNTDGL